MRGLYHPHFPFLISAFGVAVDLIKCQLPSFYFLIPRFITPRLFSMKNLDSSLWKCNNSD